MVEIFSKIYNKDKRYRLLMIGDGKLKENIINKISELKISKQVKMINKIPNSDIWQLYRIADSFVNLNQNEIFGMAILESMYYKCKTSAWKAPGPNLIIIDKESGYLVDNDEDIIKAVLENANVSIEAHRRIINSFTWENTSKKIYKLVTE